MHYIPYIVLRDNNMKIPSSLQQLFGTKADDSSNSNRNESNAK